MSNGDTTAAEARAGRIYDLLVDRPDGLTVYEIAEELGEDVHNIRPALRVLRLMLADAGDVINMPAVPQGKGNPWKYVLRAGQEDTQVWMANRTVDGESRLATIEAVALSRMQYEMGRDNPDETELRVAQRTHRTLKFLREEIAELRGE